MSKTSSIGDVTDRSRILKILVSGEQPIAELRDRLDEFEFDSGPLITLQTTDIRSILSRFLSRQLDAEYVEQWADLIEVRDDIDFDDSYEAEIKQALHDLANPILAGPLDESKAQRILGSLDNQANYGDSLLNAPNGRAR